MLPVLLGCFLLQTATVTASVGSDLADSVTTAVPVVTARPAATDTGGRAQAVELSDWYYRRLFLHRWGSYVELPLFAAEYDLGNRLFSNPGDHQLKDEHLTVAAGLGILFTANTITGGWNLLEAWPPPDHRALILTHTALMLGSDAGFAIAGALGGQANHQVSVRNTHRAVAVGSMGLAAIGTAMMWLWDR